MVFDKPITIQIVDEETEDWSDLWNLHARINKSGGGEETSSGSSRSTATLTFEVRYFKALKQIFLQTEIYRIVYDNDIYNIVDYDDFMENHKTVKITGEYYAKS